MLDISSVCEAFACVTPSICVTAVFTCSIPVDCSRDEAAISPTMSGHTFHRRDDLTQRLARLVHELRAGFDLRDGVVDERS